jgi:predicted DNA-binding protein YlxM (UPF0122 family)
MSLNSELTSWFDIFVASGGLNQVCDSLDFVIKPKAPIKETDSFTVEEFADALNIPADAVIVAMEKKRQTFKSHYTISELAEKWGVSRATVYTVLRESEAKLFNAASKTNKQRDCWRTPAAVVERIEKARTQRLPEESKDSPSKSICVTV